MNQKGNYVTGDEFMKEGGPGKWKWLIPLDDLSMTRLMDEHNDKFMFSHILVPTEAKPKTDANGQQIATHKATQALIDGSRNKSATFIAPIYVLASAKELETVRHNLKWFAERGIIINLNSDMYQELKSQKTR